MQITNTPTAQAYAHSWSASTPTRKALYCRIAADGLKMAIAIMETYKRLYSTDQIADLRAAVSVLLNDGKTNQGRKS